MGLWIKFLFQKLSIFIYRFLYDYIVNIHKYIRKMYRISYIPVLTLSTHIYLIKYNKIKILSDGIVDWYFNLKNTGIYTSIYMHLYSKYIHLSREMHPISYIPIQFMKRQFPLIKYNKIKILSDGIVDPQPFSKNRPVYTSIYMHLYSKYT